MGKADFWKTDWFFGLVVSLGVLAFSGGDLLQSLERKAYDAGMAMTSRLPSDRVAVIAIDKQSLDNIGRWPWSRDVFADMVEKLAAAKAKVIGTTILFSEPQLDPGLTYINRLLGVYTEAGGLPQSATPEELGAQPPPLAQMATVLFEAERKLNTDRRLAAAFAQAGRKIDGCSELFSLGVTLS